MNLSGQVAIITGGSAYCLSKAALIRMNEHLYNSEYE